MNETLQLLEAVANSNPEALLANGGAESVLKLLESAKASGKSDMVAVCMRSLEKINKVPGGSEKLAELGAIDSLMDSIQTVYATPEEAEAILLPCMNMLERMCRQPAIAEQIQGQDGMMKICAALDRYPALEKVAKSGGRVLTKLAAGNVEDLIKRMETASPEEKAFLSQLLANLALEDENVEQIVEAGGISSLITLLSSSGGKALSASVRAITRIASQHENVDKLLQGGVVESLISALAANPGDEEIMSAVAPCLVQLMHSPEGLRRIVEAGGIDAVLSSLMDKLDSESNVEQMMKLFEHLGTTDYDIEQLVYKGAVKSVIDGMYAFPKNKDIQLN
ncbi:KINUB, partial [Symbiodinium sp. KB8]